LLPVRATSMLLRSIVSRLSGPTGAGWGASEIRAGGPIVVERTSGLPAKPRPRMAPAIVSVVIPPIGNATRTHAGSRRRCAAGDGPRPGCSADEYRDRVSSTPSVWPLAWS